MLSKTVDTYDLPCFVISKPSFKYVQAVQAIFRELGSQYSNCLENGFQVKKVSYTGQVPEMVKEWVCFRVLCVSKRGMVSCGHARTLAWLWIFIELGDGV